MMKRTDSMRERQHRQCHSRKLISGFILLGLLLLHFASAAQIGGNVSPLQYSVHTYSVVMDDPSYNSNWGLYVAGTTDNQIINGTATALVNGVDYTQVGEPWESGGTTYFRIQFSTIANGPTALGQYVVGYKETTSDAFLCVGAVSLTIEVFNPFDVDVELADPADQANCNDDTGDLKTPGNLASQTTVAYLVNVVYPGAGEGGYDQDLTWSFDFTVTADGAGSGTNATIASITATGTDLIPRSYAGAVGTSSYTGSLTVDPSQVDPVTFTIVFNDVLGVNQAISFGIANIEGAYQEPDIDEVDGTPGNSLTHTIYSMPNVGDIVAWN